MFLGQEYFILGDWFRLHFTENPGMAFGVTLGSAYGKLILSLFRITAVCLMLYFLKRLIEAKATKGLIISLAFILAGALGNIIDSAFYGLVFTGSHHGVAQVFPEGGGYASFLHGKVVDMLYFPIYNDYLPEWIPLLGGGHFEFFRPIFNIADVSITLGVLSILLFQRQFFKEDQFNPAKMNLEEETEQLIAAETSDSPTTEEPPSQV